MSARTYQLVGSALGLVLFACLSACQLETEPDNNSDGEIVSFSFSQAENPGLPEDIAGSLYGDNIAINVPAESDVTSLIPTVQYKGAEVSPASGVAQDFTDPVTYTVTTPQGRERAYTVNVVKAASSSKDITHFLIDSVAGTISGTDITLTMPFGTDVRMLRPSVIHTGVSVRPDSGTFQDFTEPVEYAVTARDGTTTTYTVFVSVAQSDAKDIISFAIGNTVAEINGTQITLSLPFGTDVRELAASITHTGVSVSPASGSEQDFRGPVQYTVSAADGTTQRYTVLVSITPDNAKSITRFTLAGRIAAISGSAINVTLPFGTDLSALAPVVQHTGKSLSPATGAAQDFREPVRYTVTAADGSTTVYIVTVSVAPNTAKEITAFEVLGNSAQINGTSITLTLPFGTPVSALVPTITYSGTSIQPASGAARNFLNPVSYLVTAADGSTRTYEVTITVAPSDAKEITQFRLAGANGNITGDAISVTVPFSTELTSIAPEITHNGASIDPASGQARNFSTPQMYTVMAQDGTTHVYTVTVTRAPSSAKAITSVSVLGVTASPVGTAITLTLPSGSMLNPLAPVIMHTGASISPASGTMRNFTTPQTYTVTAQDGSTEIYTVTITVAPSSAKNITSFVILDVPGVISHTANTIALTVPFGTNRMSLTPTIVHQGASISPNSGVARNFSSPVTYTVVAADESMKAYVVTVTVAPSSAKEITAFSINGVTGNISGTQITLTLPHGTDRTALAPMLTHTGQTIDFASGTPRNFTNPVTYRVTAEDGTSNEYTVTVNLTPASDAKDITAFVLPNATVAIATSTISVTLPAGTNVTALAPLITVSPDARVAPASETPHDFTNPVTYTVTAQNNSTKDYVVTVTLSP